MGTIEALGALLVKLGWTLILPYLFWSYKKDKTKLDNTYTKSETDKMITLKVDPLNDKFDAFISLMKEDNAKNTKQRGENTTLLQGIKTDVAVIKNEIDHIKGDINKIQNH